MDVRTHNIREKCIKKNSCAMDDKLYLDVCDCFCVCVL